MDSRFKKLDPETIETRTAAFSVYLMDLWSFIPYYMSNLCTALRAESVDARLGSVQYHLDRNYFRNVGIRTDPVLLDFGGGLKSTFLRRILKTFEYFVNLFVLGLRLPLLGPHILHVQFLPLLDRGFQFEIWFLQWIRSRGVKIVYTVHNLADRDSRDDSKPLYEEVYGLADAIICHGREAREKLISNFKVPAEKIRIIPHGPMFSEKGVETKVESRVKLGLPVDETLVLCAGVINEYKGIPFLLDAWKRLAESGVKKRLLIAGTGDANLLDQVRGKVEAEHLGPTVSLWLRFIPVAELPLLYQAADILVYPYKAGTTSGALLTGLNYEKAIITTRLPFFREHLKEDVEAIMVDYGDIDGMAQALARLINEPEKRESLSRGATKRIATDDSWKNIARATMECYRSSSGGTGSSRS
jgi:glycosyltransferase involved in cell wall biosynthesis